MSSNNHYPYPKNLDEHRRPRNIGGPWRITDDADMAERFAKTAVSDSDVQANRRPLNGNARHDLESFVNGEAQRVSRGPTQAMSLPGLTQGRVADSRVALPHSGTIPNIPSSKGPLQGNEQSVSRFAVSNIPRPTVNPGMNAATPSKLSVTSTTHGGVTPPIDQYPSFIGGAYTPHRRPAAGFSNNQNQTRRTHIPRASQLRTTVAASTKPYQVKKMQTPTGMPQDNPFALPSKKTRPTGAPQGKDCPTSPTLKQVQLRRQEHLRGQHLHEKQLPQEKTPQEPVVLPRAEQKKAAADALTKILGDPTKVQAPTTTTKTEQLRSSKSNISLKSGSTAKSLPESSKHNASGRPSTPDGKAKTENEFVDIAITPPHVPPPPPAFDDADEWLIVDANGEVEGNEEGVEVVQLPDGSEHNGTHRKWYKLFRR